MSNRYLYQCPVHGEHWDTTVGCNECDRLKTLNAKQEEVNARVKESLPKHHRFGRPICYWDHEDARGRSVENLGHTPAKFSTQNQMSDYLKRNNIRERG